MLERAAFRRATQNAILNHKNQCLRRALGVEKRPGKRKAGLTLREQEKNGEYNFYDSKEVREAVAYQETKEARELAEKKAKAEKKDVAARLREENARQKEESRIQEQIQRDMEKEARGGGESRKESRCAGRTRRESTKEAGTGCCCYSTHKKRHGRCSKECCCSNTQKSGGQGDQKQGVKSDHKSSNGGTPKTRQIRQSEEQRPKTIDSSKISRFDASCCQHPRRRPSGQFQHSERSPRHCALTFQMSRMPIVTAR